MTSATFSDYEKHIGQDDMNKYNNPGITGNLELASNYIVSENGIRNFKVNLINCSQKDTNFSLVVTLFFASTVSVLSGVWVYFPYVLTGGFLGHSYCAIQDAVINVRVSNDYREWKGKNSEKKVTEVFKNFLCEDPILCHHLCSMSDELPEVPVRAPDGQLYEREKIVQWLQNKHESANAGLYINYTERDLNFDFDHFSTVIKRIKVLVEIELDRLDLEPQNIRIIKDGLLAYKRTKDAFNNHLLQELLKNCRHNLETKESLEDVRGRDFVKNCQRHGKDYAIERDALIKQFESFQLCIEDKGK